MLKNLENIEKLIFTVGLKLKDRMLRILTKMGGNAMNKFAKKEVDPSCVYICKDLGYNGAAHSNGSLLHHFLNCLICQDFHVHVQ